MITLLSPAKNLNFKTPSHSTISSQANFQKESLRLIRALRKLKQKDLVEMMDISEKLAAENYSRYKAWQPEFTAENSKQAVLAFNGEVYYGLKAIELKDDALLFAQDHLRILSGLHGILKPLDLVQPYRLEMGTKLAVGKYKNLYEFWDKKIFKRLYEELKLEETLVNLASNEYSKVAMLPRLKARIITPVFKDLKGEEYKVIFVYAKRARGLMARFIIDNRINDPEQLKLFESGGYFYNENLSEGDRWVFTR